MAGANDDAARFMDLYRTERTKQEVVLDQFRAALSTGDPQTVTAFITSHGSHLGRGSEEGVCERIVLELAMQNEGDSTLKMIGLFFRELGGRFMISSRFDVCVFCLLIQIDHARWLRSTGTVDDLNAAVDLWTARMAEVVRYLVEDLRFPIRLPDHNFSMYSISYGQLKQPLMQLARNAGAWSVYCAFGQYNRMQQQDGEDQLLGLLHKVLTVSPWRTVAYWVRYFGIRTLSDDALQTLHNRIAVSHEQPEALEVTTAEIQLRTEQRVHMFALVTMQSRDPSNGMARSVFENVDVNRLIHKLAWEGMRF